MYYSPILLFDLPLISFRNDTRISIQALEAFSLLGLMPENECLNFIMSVHQNWARVRYLMYTLRTKCIFNVETSEIEDDS